MRRIEVMVTKARADRSTGKVVADGTATAGRRRQVRHRQQEILDAAAAIFRDKGYEATSTQDIAEAVGLLKGSLYYYIDSKEDLLFAIIDEAYKGALAALERSKAKQGNALQKLRWVIESHVEHFTAHQVEMAVLFRDFRSLSEERQRIIAQEGDQYLEEVRTLIRQGQAEGVVAPDIDPRLTSLGITGMVNSLAQWYDPSGPSTPAELSEAFVRLIIGGLASDAAHAHAALTGDGTADRESGDGGLAADSPADGARAGSGTAGRGRSGVGTTSSSSNERRAVAMTTSRRTVVGGGRRASSPTKAGAGRTPAAKGARARTRPAP
jgi:AcrR family transcriptional regulator